MNLAAMQVLWKKNKQTKQNNSKKNKIKAIT